MDRVITLFCALVLAAAGMWGWDRRPPVHYVLPWWTGHMHVGLPDSLATQRDMAQQAAWASLEARNACLAQVGSQNAAIGRLSQESAQKLAASERALQSAKAIVESYRQASVNLDAYKPQGGGECQRWNDADRAVVGNLQ